MAGTVLKNIVSFTGLVTGVPVSQPHLLTLDTVPVIPNLIAANAAGFTITADDINVTVTKTALAAGSSVEVYLEQWHTIEAVEPPGGLASFFPFIISNSGSGPQPPPPIETQIVNVNKGGNDITGDGSAAKPFLTIQAALTSITDSSTTKRYEVSVGPGEYADPFLIKPWTAIVGVGAGSNGATPDGFAVTEITAPANTVGFDPSFATSGFSVGWYAALGFTNNQTWAEPAGSQPQLNFNACSFNAMMTYTGPGTTGTDNVMWYNCLSFGGATITGWQFFWTQRCTFLGGAININSGPAGAVESTTWLAEDCAVGAAIAPTPVNLTWAVPSPVGAMAKADLENSSITGPLTLNGANTSFVATVGGIPASVTLLAGAPAPVAQTQSNSLGYTATVPANWSGTSPSNVQQALDRIAAKIGPIP